MPPRSSTASNRASPARAARPALPRGVHARKQVLCDDTYANRLRVIVGQGMLALREVNQMEREMRGYLGWRLNMCIGEAEMFERGERAVFGRDWGGKRGLSADIKLAPPQELQRNRHVVHSSSPSDLCYIYICLCTICVVFA